MEHKLDSVREIIFELNLIEKNIFFVYCHQYNIFNLIWKILHNWLLNFLYVIYEHISCFVQIFSMKRPTHVEQVELSHDVNVNCH